jgi:hypothetical protein
MIVSSFGFDRTRTWGIAPIRQGAEIFITAGLGIFRARAAIHAAEFSPVGFDAYRTGRWKLPRMK